MRTWVDLLRPEPFGGIRLEVQGRVDHGSLELVENILYQRDRIRILLRGGVQSAVVDAESRAAILLHCQHYWRCPRRLRWPDNTLLQHLVNVFFHDAPF